MTVPAAVGVAVACAGRVVLTPTYVIWHHAAGAVAVAVARTVLAAKLIAGARGIEDTEPRLARSCALHGPTASQRANRWQVDARSSLLDTW